MDNRTFKRIAYRVLDHDPTQDDIRQFFQDFQARLELRGLVVRGITTDGSALYPEPIQQVFGDVPHQICTFHVIAELTRAVLGAVAKVRKTLAGRKPKLPRNRPSKRARKAARQSKRIGQKVAELFEHRYLFMKHHLSPAEQKTIRRITRGLPQLRTLRQIMDEATGCSIVAAAQTPPWPNWHGCAAAWPASNRWARPCRSSFRPTWSKR